MRGARLRPVDLPSPYFHTSAQEGVDWLGGAGIPALGAWPSANRGIYVPFFLPVESVVYGVQFLAGTASGNYDLGVYDRAFSRLISSGTVALSAAGTKTLTIPEWLIGPRDLFYIGLVLSTTDTVLRRAPAIASYATVQGIGQEAIGSTVLPSTATPAQPASAYIPSFALQVR